MEREVVHRNLLGQFGPLIVKVCANPNGFFNNPLLRASAVLALLKFMTVSAEFWYDFRFNFHLCFSPVQYF
jgi:hypothetical protein